MTFFTAKSKGKGDCSTVTEADLSLTRQESGESTWEPVNDSEWATNSANGSISSLIVWTDLQPPGNVAIVSVLQGFREDGTFGPARRKSFVGCDLTAPKFRRSVTFQ
jgi:hypothetical protein